MSKPTAIVVGAGPAGLAAAETLAQAGVAVTVVERSPNPARKFLLAGRGGLNLTHSEPLEDFLARYGGARAHLDAVIRAYPPDALRAWCEALGSATFVGTSGRVFPREMKATPLLRAWLARLAGFGVTLQTRRRWVGWSDASGTALKFEAPDGPETLRADVAVFALGGASWPRLGADGGWAPAFAAAGVETSPLRPSNCGFKANWSANFAERFAGAPIKSAAFSFGGARVRGEAIATRDGLEGGAIYALSAALRDALERGEATVLEIDLAPDLAAHALAKRIAAAPAGTSLANRLRKARLPPIAAALLRESAAAAPDPADPEGLALALKSVRIVLAAPFDIARAISSAGGVAWSAIGADFQLLARPGAFVCGEMLDWEAPTGGYLLQACFATGRAAGQGALAELARAA